MDVHGKKERGKTKRHRRRTINREIKEKNVNHDGVLAMAGDRPAWRNFVADL